MSIEFITEIEKKKKKGRKLSTFWEWEVQIQKTRITMIFILTKEWPDIYILNQLYYINQTPIGASNMQRITQLLRRIKKLETVINIKGNFRRFEVSIFHEVRTQNILKIKTFKNRTLTHNKTLLVLIKKRSGPGLTSTSVIYQMLTRRQKSK